MARSKTKPKQHASKLKVKPDDPSWVKGSDESVEAGARKRLRVTLYSRGASPVEHDVEPDDEGNFQINDSLSFTIAPGSVTRGLDGVLRTIAHEDNAMTVNAAAFTGDNVMHPRTNHANIHNNMIKQWHDIQGKKGFWSKGSTWAYIGIGLGVIGVLFWLVKTMGAGFEDLIQALESFKLRIESAPSGGASDPSGHQPIAPEE